jgi:hypothetical protein
MALQGNLPKGPTRVGIVPRTADEFDRLAMAFRPVWELDDAIAQAENETYVRPQPAATTAPVASVVVERTLAPAPAPPAPQPRPSAPSLGAESLASFARPSRMPIWLGAGVMAIVLAGAGAWAMSGGKEKPAPALEVTVQQAENAKVSAIPPPPPETATDSPAAAPTPVLAAAPPMAVSPPATGHTQPAAQPAARSAYTPHARPAARKGPSIVRDAPF